MRPACAQAGRLAEIRQGVPVFAHAVSKGRHSCHAGPCKRLQARAGEAEKRVRKKEILRVGFLLFRGIFFVSLDKIGGVSAVYFQKPTAFDLHCPQLSLSLDKIGGVSAVYSQKPTAFDLHCPQLSLSLAFAQNTHARQSKLKRAFTLLCPRLSVSLAFAQDTHARQSKLKRAFTLLCPRLSVSLHRYFSKTAL